MSDPGTDARHIRWPVARLIWRAGGWRASLWSATIVAGALLTVAGLVAFGHVVGSVPGAAGAGLGSPAGHRLLLASLAATAAFLLSQAARNVLDALDRTLGRRVEAQLQLDALDALAGIQGLTHLEEPAVRAVLESVGDVETAVHPAGIVVRSLQTIATGALMAIMAGVVLATFRWWAPFVLVVGWMLQDLWGHVHHRTLAGSQRELEHLQRYDSYRSLALDSPAAKEVRVFGLGAWIAGRAERHWQVAMAPVWRSRRVPRLLVAAIVLVQLTANASVVWLIVRAGARGDISLTRFAVYLGTGIGLGPLMNLVQPHAMMTFRHAAQPIGRLAALTTSWETTPAPGERSQDDRSGTAPREIRFDGVRFRYPGSDRDVLVDLDLRIPGGSSVAIVGENGAGKTTLVKLLTRLYEPDAGSIRRDGRPLAQLDAGAWRREIGIIFQDFVRYPLSVRENVTFGWLGAADAEAHLAHAARAAGLEPLVASLPAGWDTVLSREHRGTDLSGGQWQRVALARALFSVQAGARLLILDEPTASLDVRLEAELFDRLLELTRGVTTVLVSHRFSTVRRVDHIYVVEHGRVAEHGSHDELIAHGGRYAEMFALQASPFRIGAVGDA